MNYKELASKIKAKYPGQYDDMSDIDLAKKIVAKYPVYSDIDFTDTQPGLIPEAIETVKETVDKVSKGIIPGLKTGISAYTKIAELFGAGGERYLRPEMAEKFKKTGKITPEMLEEETGADRMHKELELTDKDLKNLKEGGWQSQIGKELISTVVDLPLYLLAGGFGGAAAEALTGRLALKIGIEQAPKVAQILFKFLKGSIGMGVGFGALQGLETAGTPGATVSDIGKAVKSAVIAAPIYTAGGIGGKVILGKTGQVIGNIASMTAATALQGGKGTELISAAIIGGAFSLSDILGDRPKILKEANEAIAKKDIGKLTDIIDKNVSTEKINNSVKTLKSKIDNATPKEADLLKTAIAAKEQVKTSNIDELTGLKRRQIFVNDIDPKTPGIGIFDIDHFKLINDTYGHAGGDAVLKELGRRLNEFAILNKLNIGRIGGEEIGLTNMPEGKEAQIMADAKAYVERKPFDIFDKKIKITLSGGYGERIAGDTPWKKADEFLYKAKEAGRNQIQGEIKPAKPSPTIEQPAPAEAAILPGEKKIGAGLSPEQMVMGGEKGIKPVNPIAEYDKKIDNYSNKYIAPIKEQKPYATHGPLEWFNYNIISRNFPAQKLIKGIEEKIPPYYNPVYSLRNKTNVENIVAVQLGISGGKHPGGTFDWTMTGVEFNGEPLKAIIEPHAQNYKDITALLTARRQQELYKDIEQRKIIGITERTNNEAGELIKTLQQKYGETGFNELNSVVERISAFENRAVLKPLREVGKISEKKYKTLTSQFHTPFDREFTELENTPTGRAAGKDVEGMLKQLVGSERRIKDPINQIIIRTARVTAFVNRQRAIDGLCYVADNFPEKNAEIWRMKPGERAPFKLITYEDGKPVEYGLRDKWLYDATTKEPQDMDLVTKILNVGKRIKRAGAVLPLTFLQRNPIRDFQSGFIYSKGWGYGNYSEGIKTLLSRNEVFQKYLITGSGGAFFEDLNMFKDDYIKAVQGVKDYGWILKNPFVALQKIGTFGENAGRIPEFQKLLESRGAIRAGMGSKTITADFGDIGAGMDWPSHTTAFFTASIAGNRRFFQALRDQPVQTMVKGILIYTIPKIAEWALFHKDENWNNLPYWRKLTCINIPTGNNKLPFITIPMAWEVGTVFGGIPMMVLDYIQNKDPQVADAFAKQAINNILPGTYGAPIPDLTIPLVEHFSNKSLFTGAPLVPSSLQELPPEMQATSYTSQIFTKLGEILSISPIIAENYFTGYTAGLGKDILNIADEQLISRGILPPKEGTLPNELYRSPFLRGLTTGEPIGTGSRPVQSLYTMFSEATRYHNAVNDLEKNGIHNEKYFDYVEKSKWYDILNEAIQEVRAMRADRMAILKGTLEPAAKQAKIHQLDHNMTLYADRILIGIRENGTKKEKKE